MKFEKEAEFEAEEKIEKKIGKNKAPRKKSEPTTSLNILPKFHKYLGDKKYDK